MAWGPRKDRERDPSAAETNEAAARAGGPGHAFACVDALAGGRVVAS